jgi:hypothetical protein
MDKAKGSQTEANDLSGGSQADRGCATSKVGKCEAGGVAAAPAHCAPIERSCLLAAPKGKGKNQPNDPNSSGRWTPSRTSTRASRSRFAAPRGEWRS